MLITCRDENSAADVRRDLERMLNHVENKEYLTIALPYY